MLRSIFTIDTIRKMWGHFSGVITADNIALLSVIITALFFVISRRAELKYKKHDDVKVQYLKVIALLQKMFIGFQIDKEGNISLTEDLKNQFFDAGSSLLLYGSKKLYKQYLFFREFTSNESLKKCRYYNNNIIAYIMSDMLITMRKEVGLNRYNSVDSNEALGFMVNDITYNPIKKNDALNARFKIKMIKIELFMFDRLQFIIIKSIYYKLLLPPFAIMRLIILHFFKTPLTSLVMRVFRNSKNFHKK